MATASARPRGAARDTPDLGSPIGYGGFVTRAIAFAADGVIITAVALAVGVVVGLALSLLNVPTEVDKAVAAVGAATSVIWTVAYFVTFWSTTGQTPGDRLMSIRVVEVKTESKTIPPRRALVRLIGMTLAAIPLFAGFALVLVDDRRRGLHDRLARTVVLELRRSSPPPRTQPPAPH